MTVISDEQLNSLDKNCDNLTKKDREHYRKLTIKPMVNSYFEWAKEKYILVPPEGDAGKALAYSINQEKYLRAFLKDGDIPMDNLETGYKALHNRKKESLVHGICQWSQSKRYHL